MRKLILFLALVYSAQAQTVSNVAAPAAYITDSTALITFNISGGSSSPATLVRLRAGTTGSYEAGADGWQDRASHSVGTLGTYRIAMSGLKAASNYQGCVEGSNNNGATWSASCATVSFTTAALSSPSPALPPSWTEYKPSMPDTTGYTPLTATTCNNLQTHINTANTNRASGGYVITMTPGVPCTGTIFPGDPAAKTITAWDATANTATSNSHGWTAGQMIHLSRRESGPGRDGALPTASNMIWASGMQDGWPYYVCNPTTNTFQLSEYSDCSVILDLTNTGTGSLTKLALQWPPVSNWIIVKSSSSNCTPEGITPVVADRTSMFTLTANGGIGGTGTVLPQADLALSFNTFAHHYRLVCAEITHTAAATATRADPRPTRSMGTLLRDAAYIVIDRGSIHGLGAPDRLERWFDSFGGEHIAVMHNEMSELNYPRTGITPPRHIASGNYGFKPTLASQVITVATGTVTFPNKICANIAQTTFTKTSTGANALQGFAEAKYSDCTIQLTIPTGETADCTGPCSVVTAASNSCVDGDGKPREPTWETTSSAYVNAQLFHFCITSGTWGTPVTDVEYQLSLYLTEGTQGSMGNSIDYITFYGNTIEGTGNLLHFDDSGWPNSCGTHYYIANNIFWSPTSYRPGSLDWDGLDRMQRNGAEWKGGCAIRVENNRWYHFYSQVLSTGSALIFTPRLNVKVNDIVIKNNSFLDGCGAIDIWGAPNGNGGESAITRVLIANNFFRGDGDQRAETYTGACNPWPVFVRGKISDFTFNNNTVDGRLQRDSSDWLQTDEATSIGGFEANYNVFLINGGSGSYGVRQGTPPVAPVCTGLNNLAALDCIARSGGTSSAYAWLGNVMAGIYSDGAARMGNLLKATLDNVWDFIAPKTNTVLPDGSGPADRIAALAYTDEYCRGPGSVLTAEGVDCDTQLAAQGVTRNVSKLGNVLLYTAPSTAACAIAYSSNGGTSWAYTLDAGGLQSRFKVMTSAGLYEPICLHRQAAEQGFVGSQITQVEYTPPIFPALNISLRGAYLK